MAAKWYYVVIVQPNGVESGYNLVYADNLDDIRAKILSSKKPEGKMYFIYPSKEKYDQQFRWPITDHLNTPKKPSLIGILGQEYVDGKKAWVWRTERTTSTINKDGTKRKK